MQRRVKRYCPVSGCRISSSTDFVNAGDTSSICSSAISTGHASLCPSLTGRTGVKRISVTIIRRLWTTYMNYCHFIIRNNKRRLCELLKRQINISAYMKLPESNTKFKIPQFLEAICSRPLQTKRLEGSYTRAHTPNFGVPTFSTRVNLEFFRKN